MKTESERLRKEKFIYMTETPVERLVCRMAVPTIVSMLVTSFYNMADTFFVGRIDTSATGAVGIVFSLMAIIQAVGFFFGQGSGNYISRKLGAREIGEASRMAATGFVSAFCAGILIAVCGLVFLEELSRMLGSTDTILPHAMSYMRIILLGAPFMASSLVLNNQLRFQGNAIYAMVGIASGAVLNIALDPLFIFTFGMGVAGAALATIISQIVSFCLLIIGCTRGSNIAIRLREFSPSVRKYVEIVRGGAPSFFRQGLACVAVIALNLSVRGYGDAAVAGMSIVGRVMMFAGSALIGFGQGFQPVCGFNFGAGRYDRVLGAFWFCMKVSVVVLSVLAVVGLVFAPSIIALFRKEDALVIEIGARALRLQCLAFPVMAWIVLNNMMMQNIGEFAKASVLAMARQGIFFIPLIFVLPRFFGLLGVQLCQPISDYMSLALALPLSFSVLKRLKAEMEEAKKSGEEAMSGVSQPEGAV